MAPNTLKSETHKNKRIKRNYKILTKASDRIKKTKKIHENKQINCSNLEEKQKNAHKK